MAGLLAAAGQPLEAATISSNLAATTGGTETATGSTWLTASFGTSTTTSTLDAVTLLLANSATGIAEVDIYSDGLLAPGSLIGTLTSPSSYGANLAAATFSSNSLTLSANSTYWVVLKASGGAFEWAWTSDSSGSGSGYQGVWGISYDSGSTWYSSSVYPFQMSVTTTASALATPEPSSFGMGSGGFLLLGGALFYRARSQKRRNEEQQNS